MTIEIINTGSELLSGSVLNTHQQWLCNKLFQLGYRVSRQITTSDTAEDIKTAVLDSINRADVIITTGGLGPTSDDRTRDVIAEIFGRKLIYDENVAEQIKNYFALRKRHQPESTKIQAYVPECATVLQNQFGTAPGIVIEAMVKASHQPRKVLLIMLPGPPRELYPMFENQVIPLLKEKVPPPYFVSKIIKTTGIGESKVEEIVGEKLKPCEKNGLILGYCARVGEVDLRLEAFGNDAHKIVNQAEQIIRESIGEYIYGEGNQTLEAVIVEILKKKGLTVSFAESCTGGFVSHRITNVPGASEVFWGGIVSYANDAKMKVLGVKEESLNKFGAVSEQVAKEMADGLRKLAKTDFAVSLTGIAGPSGGSPEKPVGTVYIGLSHKNGTVAKRNFNPYDRLTFKQVTSQQAFELLRRELLKIS